MTLEEEIESLKKRIEWLEWIVSKIVKDVPEIRYPDDIERKGIGGKL